MSPRRPIYSGKQVEWWAGSIGAYPFSETGVVERAAIWLAMDAIIPELLSKAATDKFMIEDLTEYLPARYQLKYDDDFWRKFTIVTIGLFQRMAGGGMSPFTTSLAEDVALEMVLRFADNLWSVVADDGMVIKKYAVEPDFDELRDAAFWDSDHQWLYDDAFDGAAEAYPEMGASSQAFADWFDEPYSDARLHPFLATARTIARYAEVKTETED